MNYIYVTYYYMNENGGPQGWGGAGPCLTSHWPPTMKDIYELQHTIASSTGVDRVLVTGWQLISVDPEESHIPVSREPANPENTLGQVSDEVE